MFRNETLSNVYIYAKEIVNFEFNQIDIHKISKTSSAVFNVLFIEIGVLESSPDGIS